MKSILFACCLLFAASAIRADNVDSYLEKSKDQVVACGKENGYTDLNPRAIYDKYMKDAAADQPDCVGACVMKALGTMVNSKLDTAKLNEFNKSAFPNQPEMHAKLEKTTSDCVEKAKSVSEECKMAYTYINCFMSNQ